MWDVQPATLAPFFFLFRFSFVWNSSGTTRRNCWESSSASVYCAIAAATPATHSPSTRAFLATHKMSDYHRNTRSTGLKSLTELEQEQALNAILAAANITGYERMSFYEKVTLASSLEQSKASANQETAQRFAHQRGDSQLPDQDAAYAYIVQGQMTPDKRGNEGDDSEVIIDEDSFPVVTSPFSEEKRSGEKMLDHDGGGAAKRLSWKDSNKTGPSTRSRSSAAASTSQVGTSSQDPADELLTDDEDETVDKLSDQFTGLGAHGSSKRGSGDLTERYLENKVRNKKEQNPYIPYEYHPSLGISRVAHREMILGELRHNNVLMGRMLRAEKQKKTPSTTRKWASPVQMARPGVTVTSLVKPGCNPPKRTELLPWGAKPDEIHRSSRQENMNFSTYGTRSRIPKETAQPKSYEKFWPWNCFGSESSSTSTQPAGTTGGREQQNHSHGASVKRPVVLDSVEESKEDKNSKKGRGGGTARRARGWGLRSSRGGAARGKDGWNPAARGTKAADHSQPASPDLFDEVAYDGTDFDDMDSMEVATCTQCGNFFRADMLEDHKKECTG